MTPAPSLAELIATVETDAPSADPLARLATASSTSAELTQTGDSLVGHYVDQCRAAGHSWAEISDALGVSKQAAHKRYSAVPRELSRFTERARGAIAASVDAARGLAHPFVGTEHLLAGPFPPGGIAANLLQGWGLTEAKVAEAIVAATPRGEQGPAEPPFTPKAAEVFAGALSEALALGHNYIGTEHLLLALFRDEGGLAAQILAGAGASYDDAKAAVIQILSGYRS
jgi:hypothetical protein